MSQPKIIEILAPAKNMETAIAAIDHGADAVYIGADQFGARSAAGNSLEDIAEVVRYAHQFNVKVFVPMNTVLTDDQLAGAEKQIHALYNIGVDAIIIQDMGILQLNLPPIEIHASTQTDNRTVQKVNFLRSTGISRVVLARELTLKEIQNIHNQVDVELEAFVHGALCVSYSGQCYISQAMTGRSANRGECAQYCRLPYQLYDADGKILAKNKHLLSLKDLDLSDNIEELMDAGVTSLKIEGRLKDIEYVKNITAYYRKKVDEILLRRNDFQRASSGVTNIFFEPQPDKSFRRSNTDYFLHGRHKSIFQPDTPKSLGEPIGKVLKINKQTIEIESNIPVNNGDGLCFINQSGELTGFRVNKSEGNIIFPGQMPQSISTNDFLYRNQDHEFEKILKNKTSERKIQVDMIFREVPDGFELALQDEDKNYISYPVIYTKEISKNAEKPLQNIENQLTKSGQTIFNIQKFNSEISSPWFFPASVLNDWRRNALDLLLAKRISSYQRRERKEADKETVNYPVRQLSYLGNVTNKKASLFYKEHGVESIQPGFEIKAEAGVPLMFTKHCVKFEMGWCPKEGNKPDFKEPLFIENNGEKFKLFFDCKNCMMQISHVSDVTI